MADGLSILSMNVKGLRRRAKRRSAFNFFKQRKFDIICLQETHITESVKDEWEREWKNGLVYNAGTPKSLGQVILFSNKFSEINVVASTSRFLAASVKNS